MRTVLATVVAMAVLLLAPIASATPQVLRAGANHHLGDDSFIARFGREPTAADNEAVRMRVHLEYVHDLLASRPATKPALEGRRAELLGYLAEYIAKGTTPKNTYLPYRNPVFIDRDGMICAVGYLIERSVGRALPETIAATHRLDYLEDIAAAMPEVAGWVESSGLTLDELASIQPGYPGPEVMHLTGWLVARKGDDNDQWQDPIGLALPEDGPYQDEHGVAGRFKRGQMVGTWKRKLDGKLLGKGKFEHGAGTWTSFRPDGTKLAVGSFVKSHADGEWRIFHPSGRLAAVGTMHGGKRDGAWKFFYDTRANQKLATGTFANGEVMSGWKHFDKHGKLVATTSGRAWAGITLEIEPGKDGVRHDIHQGLPADSARMDGLYLGNEKLYVTNNGDMFDGRGNMLVKTESGWQAHKCKWSRKRKSAARNGDVTTLHGMLLKRGWDPDVKREDDSCDGEAVDVAASRVKKFEKMFASRAKIHAPIPRFDVEGREVDETDDVPVADEPLKDDTAGQDNAEDMATYLTNFATWYIEWPHVDNTFRAVYRSLPGYGEVADRG